MYSPIAGRFMTEDPLGDESGDSNYYRYCHNNPVTWTDPSGQDDTSPKPSVGMVADTHALRLPLGDPDYFKITLVRPYPFKSNLPSGPFRMRFKVEFKTSNDAKFGAARWDDLESTELPDHNDDVQTLKNGFYDFPAMSLDEVHDLKQTKTLIIKATRKDGATKADGTADSRPKQFYVEILDDPAYITVPNESHYDRLERTNMYTKAYFTIYSSPMIALRPRAEGAGDLSAVDPNDLAQLAHDCYFMAALIAAVRANPKQVEDMIKSNGDGSYTVELAGAASQSVRLSLDRGKDMVDVSPADVDESGNVEVWPVIMERAIAQTRLAAGEGPTLFDALAGGDSGPTYEAITGRKAIGMDPSRWLADQRDIALARATAIKRWIGGTAPGNIKQQVMISTNTITGARPYAGWLMEHVYVVKSVNLQRREMVLIDPLKPTESDPKPFGWIGDDRYLKYVYMCK